ncbi:MAG: hypothetical protein GY861_18760 [bacterium]|nr:hypothetical protein [bacterium]
MKKIVEQVETEGLEKLLGERVTLFCCRYIYTGRLIGVNDNCVLLTNCGIVYSTGDFNDKEWSEYQKLPHDWYVATQSIESFGILK